LQKQPLLLAAVSFCLAVWYAESGLFAVLGMIFLTLILAATVSGLTRAIFILTLLAGIAGYGFHRHSLNTLKEMRAHAGERVELLVAVDSPPKYAGKGKNDVVVSVIQSSQPVLTGQRVIARLPSKLRVNVGEKLWLAGTLHLPPRAMNPNEIDQAQVLKRMGIALIVRASKCHNTHEVAASHSIRAWAEKSRQWIKRQLTLGIENHPSTPIILAMFLGEKPARTSPVMGDFISSGTVHVFAVSGMHVMMIGLIFALFLRLIGCPAKLWVPAVICIMFFYATVTGMRPPAMRAAVMASIVLCALLIGRRPTLGNSLWLSALIALSWNTHSLFVPGFQLSYAVLIAIVFTGAWWSRKLRFVSELDPFMPLQMLTWKQQCGLSLRKKAAATMSVSASAWCGSSVLIWLYFGLITPIAIIASLPMVLTVFALLTTCCLSLTVGAISDHLAVQINRLNTHNAQASGDISHYFASLPYGHFKSQPWQSGERIVVYSMPAGEAANYICIGGGVLVDAGTTRSFYRHVFPSLQHNSARLDSLIATHTDYQHYTGLLPSLDSFAIHQVMLPPTRRRTASLKKLVRLSREHGISILSPELGFYPLSKAASLEIIYPDRHWLSYADDRCTVLLLHWENHKILFLSDSGMAFESWLQSHRPDLRADICILAKHKEDPSISVETLRRLGSHTVIASDASYPSSESRAPSWKRSLRENGINLLILSQTGAITITRDSKSQALTLTPFLKH